MFAAFAGAVAAASLTPQNLVCEYRVDPVGIGEVKPRLGWKLAATEEGARGLRQSAYQIVVASSPEELALGRGDLWDSGRVESSLTAHIEYDGKPLGSRDHCWWSVRVWDGDGAVSGWSAPASWSMGLLKKSDWSAEWIGLDAPWPADGTAVPREQAARLHQATWVHAVAEPSKSSALEAWMRRAFEMPADRKVSRASLVIVPDQRADVFLNGRLVGHATRWDRAAPVDITDSIVAGENVLGLHIAQDDGNPPAATGEIEIVFTEGDPMRVPVDESWHATLTAPERGWDRKGFAADAPGWSATALFGRRKTPWGSPQQATTFLPPPPFLRKEFTLSQPVRRATLHATALGLYEVHVNGTRVGEDVFTPGWTEYRRRVQYQTYDVTGLVRPGANAVGAILGSGWFAGTYGFYHENHHNGMPRFLAQLELELADGTRVIVPTDATWRASHGPIVYADMQQGSAIDARRAWPDWARAGFDDSSWRPVTTGRHTARGEPVEGEPEFLLEAATIEPPRVIEELPAVSVASPAPGTFIYDFGQNLVGWVRLRASGDAGRKIVLRHGEILNPNGSLYMSNLRGAASVDTFWLGGGGEEMLEPKFTFHGFRYVEITGLDEPLPVDAVSAAVVHNPMTRTGTFASSDPRLNQLFHNIIWGQKGNYLEVPTDCPQRDERLGWTGDTQFFMRTAAFNFDVAAFIERWLTMLITDGQRPDGTFPVYSPAWDDKPHPSTAWGDASILCTHALWLVYGDTRIVRRHFDALERYMDFVERGSTDGIAKVGGFGDWLHKGGSAPAPVMDTAYHAHLCRLMSEMASAIGRDADAARYASRFQKVKAAFQREFVLADGSIKESGQTGYALAFTMDLLPDEMKEAAAAKFVDTVAARDWHLDTGFIGTPRLLPALHAAGRDDVAYRVLFQDTYPSWLYQVDLGATTMWERWDGWTPENGFQAVGMNSFNHYAFGAVGEFLYRHVAGIETEGPGFRQFAIRPRPGPQLTHASASYDSISGLIDSAWRIEGDRFVLEATVPPNTVATIHIPSEDVAGVTESGREVALSPGVVFVSAREGETVFRAGSGRFRFEAPLKNRFVSSE